MSNLSLFRKCFLLYINNKLFVKLLNSFVASIKYFLTAKYSEASTLNLQIDIANLLVWFSRLKAYLITFGHVLFGKTLIKSAVKR